MGRRTGRHTTVAGVEDALRRLGRDHRSGATELAAALVRVLMPGLPALSRRTPDERRRILLRWARLVVAAQPAMGAFRQCAHRLRTIGSVPRPETGPLRRDLRELAGTLRVETTRVARQSASLLPPNGEFLTISQSATVLQALRRTPLHSRPERVDVTESLPGGEGRRQSAALRRIGIASAVIPDEQGPEHLRDLDGLLLGADSVFRDGTVWNKVGSRRLARAARASGVPVIVLAGGSKFVDRRPPPTLPSRLFDAVRSRDVSVILGEDGPWLPAAGRRVVRGARRARAPGRRSTA